MNKTLGILAHVDAGKTTFAEQLLYHTNSIKERGRVDHKNTLLDSHYIEKQRGITVFSDKATMRYKDSTYYLIDTPGHVDFSTEMERTLKVMDYAIVIISAVEGVQGHTETVWNLLRKYKVPTFFFINKVDRIGADVNKVLKEIKTNLTENFCDISNNLNEGEMEEELIEFIATQEEDLLERYLEKGYEKDLWFQMMKNMVKENKIFPCCYGSALQDIGVIDFFDKLHKLSYTTYSEEDLFSAQVYKIKNDESGEKVIHMKAMSGSLKVRDEISYEYNENRISEKITGIRLYNGNKFERKDRVVAGEIFGVTGLTNVSVGQGLGKLNQNIFYEMVPTLTSKVIYETGINTKEILKAFKTLEEEDPSLNVAWEESLEEIHIHVMGTIQLEILKEVVKERFNFEVSFGTPEILYKETIETEAKGYGHFEPLRHYAEVHLKLEPAKRNTGISFENNCHADDLTTGHQNLIRHHIFEREHNGLLTGKPLTDIKVTLLTGRAHNKHTSGGDFREATYRALRQGLEQAKNIVLEPYYQFRIKVDLEHMGRVLADVQKAHGNFSAPENIEDKVIIKGKVPVSTFMNYSTELVAFTGGKGTINMFFTGYDICHNENEVVEKIGYNKNIDTTYTSSSVFCSKGQGYTVPWDEAKESMHCLK
jgi:small GTP-binding protein